MHFAAFWHCTISLTAVWTTKEVYSIWGIDFKWISNCLTDSLSHFFGQPAIRKQIVPKLLLTIGHLRKSKANLPHQTTTCCYGKWSNLCILNIHILGSAILYTLLCMVWKTIKLMKKSKRQSRVSVKCPGIMYCACMIYYKLSNVHIVHC